MTVTDAPAQRCSAWTRSQDVDPVGSAGSYRGFLLVEAPLPWPRDVALIDDLTPLAEVVAGEHLRLQALVPAGADDGGRRLVLHCSTAPSDGGWFGGYSRFEATAGGNLAVAAQDLLSTASAAGADAGGGSGLTDLLVCTHGRRDVCCGSLGTELALALGGREKRRPGVYVRRTSHTGGHRFAPTFLLLPQGTLWAYADTELVDRILDRSVAFAEVAGRYRGCAGLGSPQVQALERAVLVEAGWEVLDRPRRGLATGESAADHGTVYRFETPDAAWEAVVRPGRTLPVPDCMHPISESKKTETEWVVADLRAV